MFLSLQSFEGFFPGSILLSFGLSFHESSLAGSNYFLVVLYS